MLKQLSVTKTFLLLPGILLFFVLPEFISCKKDSFLTQGGSVYFSLDTLRFDTVFTQMGSITRYIKLYNNNNKPIRISRIRLEKGNDSYFRLNVNGDPAQDIQNLELAPNDSIYIFAAVTIDPNDSTTPFVVNDKILCDFNGMEYEVYLEAFGQNAHYFRGEYIQTSTWMNDLPYVVIGSVVVDTDQVLTIDKGCTVYMHADSKMYVAGTLHINGTKEDSVIFQGDRLERDYFGYRDFPGEWRGLHFLQTASNNTIRYAIIKNGGLTDATIYLEPPLIPSSTPMLYMQNSVVANSLSYGVAGVRSTLEMENCLVHSCGLPNFVAIEGGNYEFSFCTFATYPVLGISHIQEPTMALLNYRDVSETQHVSGELICKLNNCIVYGPLENEITFLKKSGAPFYVELNHCLVKRTNAFPVEVQQNNVLQNQDPAFVNYSEWDYHLNAGSPAKGNGYNMPLIQKDLDEMPRSNPPTMGCYE